jgi:hypothetical protein
VEKVFRFFSSVKLAVVVLFGLTAALAVATFLESAYDTPTAQYYIYKSWMFLGLLALLGVNILCSALSRLPWKKRHIPFLLAHLGILMLLAGSWLTQKFGLDGNLRITEGETSSVVELDNSALLVIEKNNVKRVPVPWTPPEASFKKIHVSEYGLPYDLTIDRYLTHADPIYDFLPDSTPASEQKQGLMAGKPAVQVQLKGGPMQISQDFWLWAGDPGWSTIQAGPALLKLDTSANPEMRRPEDPKNPKGLGHPTLTITPLSGGIKYVAVSSEGKKVEGRLTAKEIEKKPVINPGWKNVSITFQKYLPRSIPQTTYKPSRIQYGQMAPSSALHLVSGKGGPGAEIWLGLGERAMLDMNGREVELAYYPQRVVLPFAIRLERFRIDHYEGTRDPSSYSSLVTVIDQNPNAKEKPPKDSIVIKMNEPLHYRGTTLYQASYEDAMPRPVTSIFSVNRDPGRVWKYLGSLLIVLGSVLLFASRYWSRKPSQSSQKSSPKKKDQQTESASSGASL